MVVGDKDPAANIYEFVPVKVPGWRDSDYLGIVLKGWSIASLADGLFVSTGI